MQKLHYLNSRPSYSQQLPVPEQVLPHTKQELSRMAPKNIGLGINAKPISIKPNPMATDLSCSSTQLSWVYLCVGRRQQMWSSVVVLRAGHMKKWKQKIIWEWNFLHSLLTKLMHWLLIVAVIVFNYIPNAD